LVVRRIAVTLEVIATQPLCLLFSACHCRYQHQDYHNRKSVSMQKRCS